MNRICKQCEKEMELNSNFFSIYNSKVRGGFYKDYFRIYCRECERQHIERQFDDNMNCNNYGIYWHIDHIIPQSCLPYTSMEEDNFKKCWALNNLRPLEAKLNIIDGRSRIRHKLFRGEI